MFKKKTQTHIEATIREIDASVRKPFDNIRRIGEFTPEPVNVQTCLSVLEQVRARDAKLKTEDTIVHAAWREIELKTLNRLKALLGDPEKGRGYEHISYVFCDRCNKGE